MENGNGVYNYHTDALISELIQDLSVKKNMSVNFATNFINMGGLTIYSTQDTKIQQEMEKEFNKNKYILNSKLHDNSTSQAAMVILDNKNGHVTGLVGGLGKKTTSRGFNRATQGIRQTGSASKPLAVLIPAIDKKIITPLSIYDDNLTTFNDGSEEGYSPINYNNYLGNITVRRAVESSQNIPFVRIMEQITPTTSINYLKDMGITTLTEDDDNINLALGGLVKGISPLEMAGAYFTISNDGIYKEPTFYTKIEDSNKRIFLRTSQKSKKVFSKQVAFILKELLLEPVNGKNGTATYCSIKNMDVAAKTGTTNDNFDRWLCGFTPYYTAVTWYGFDLNESIEFNSKNPAGLIWSEIMKNIHSNLEGKKFEMPKDIISTKICTDSHLTANEKCKNTYTEYFLEDPYLPYCTNH